MTTYTFKQQKIESHAESINYFKISNPDLNQEEIRDYVLNSYVVNLGLFSYYIIDGSLINPLNKTSDKLFEHPNSIEECVKLFKEAVSQDIKGYVYNMHGEELYF